MRLQRRCATVIIGASEMFNSINGTLTHKGNNIIYLENHGIEWELSATAKTISRLPATGSCVRIVTYLYHREDNISLYGFYDEKERSIFFELIRINGIGPKQAIKILSGITPEDFIAALDVENLSVLSALPGIGQKTAQKIVLSMRGRLLKENHDSESPYSDIVKALSDMGFDYRKASRIVADIADEPGISTLEKSEKEKNILKKAIIALSSQ